MNWASKYTGKQVPSVEGSNALHKMREWADKRRHEAVRDFNVSIKLHVNT
jgi:hypothetical protein